MTEHEIMSNLACTYCRVCHLVDPVEGEPCQDTGPSYATLRERVHQLEQINFDHEMGFYAVKEEIERLESQLATLTTAHQQAVEREQDTQRHLTATKAHLATVESGQAREDELQILHDKLASWGNLDDQYHALQAQHQQAVEALARMTKERDDLQNNYTNQTLARTRDVNALNAKLQAVEAALKQIAEPDSTPLVQASDGSMLDNVDAIVAVLNNCRSIANAALHGTGGVTFDSRGLPSQYNKDARAFQGEAGHE